jgi:hypothetical protein
MIIGEKCCSDSDNSCDTQLEAEYLNFKNDERKTSNMERRKQKIR